MKKNHDTFLAHSESQKADFNTMNQKEWTLDTELPDGWIMIDNDSYQCVHYLDPIAGSTGSKFEFYQVNKHPDCFMVAHSIIDLECYDQEAILDALHLFGYEDMDDFVQQYSPEPIPKKEDGHLNQDSPFYIIEWQLIAEMLFEMEALENEIPGIMFENYEDACHFIFRKNIGVA